AAASDGRVGCSCPIVHVFRGAKEFRSALRRAFELADAEGALVTFGITPAYPETGFGYIEPGLRLDKESPASYRVARFHEKPDAATAASYAAKGYLWNSGMFVWRGGVNREACSRHAPRAAPPVRARSASRR